MKAATRGTASSASVRGCLFDPRSNLAVFAALPLVPEGAGAAHALRLGAKYTSAAVSAGFIVNPGSSVLQSAWVVGKAGALVWGMQTAPSVRLDSVLSGRTGGGALGSALDECRAACSYAVAYQPEVHSASGGKFTAAVELERQQQLSISFLHHMAVQRNVHNPFEDAGACGAHSGGGHLLVLHPRCAPCNPILRLNLLWSCFGGRRCRRHQQLH